MEASSEETQETATREISTGPRVGVVVPCFNQAHFITECLESVRAQTWPHWSAIVVDDGSSDSEELARAIERLEDERIRLIRHEENRGRAAARNTGIAAADTELVLTLDADDRLGPHCLERTVQALTADATLDCVYGDVQLFGRSERVLSYPGPPPGTPPLRVEHALPSAGALLRKSLWERLGGFDEAGALRNADEDLEFWIRAFIAGCHSKRIAEASYEHRVVHSTAYGSTSDDEVADYVYGKHRALFDDAGATRGFLCAGLSRAARASYARGDRWRAFKLALRGWRIAPSGSRLRGSVRALLPYSLNRAIDAGEIRRLVPLAGYPLHGLERYRPFFVIGMGRSGNTLFRRILTSHSQLHLPPETFVLGRTIRKFKHQGRRLNWPDLVAMVMAQFEFHPEFHLFEMELAPLVQRLSAAPQRRRNLAYLFDAFFRHHAETHGIECLRWGDKTPMNSLDDALERGDQPRRLGAGVPETLERLLKVFPDAQFLHIYRDGCDVVSSCLKGGFFDDMESAAKRWLHVESQSRRFVRRHAERSLDVRYEDLVSRPEEIVRGVCGFLGVEFEPAMLSSEAGSSQLGDVPAWFWHAQVAKPINAANVGKARRLFTQAEKQELQRLIGPALSELGYPPATAAPQ